MPHDDQMAESSVLDSMETSFIPWRSQETTESLQLIFDKITMMALKYLYIKMSKYLIWGSYTCLKWAQ